MKKSRKLQMQKSQSHPVTDHPGAAPVTLYLMFTFHFLFRFSPMFPSGKFQNQRNFKRKSQHNEHLKFTSCRLLVSCAFPLTGWNKINIYTFIPFSYFFFLTNVGAS